MNVLEKCYAYTRADEVRAADFYPYYPIFDGADQDGGVARVDGRSMTNLGSGDYRGFTHHPQVRQAAREAIDHWGTSATDSRLLSGNIALHEQLEGELADFYGVEAALVYSAGYLANLGVVSALAGRGEAVVLDQQAHASLIDGAQLARAQGAAMKFFSRNDASSLHRTLTELSTTPTLVCVSGLHSMEGDIAALPDLLQIADHHGATLLVDDAHGLGVLARGRGSIAHHALDGQIPLTTVSFSKSLASQGGAVLADRKVIDFLRHTSRPAMFSAGLAPASAAAALTALRLLTNQPTAPRALALAARLRAALAEMGYSVPTGTGPVIPVRFADEYMLLLSHRMLTNHGIYSNPILPPAAEGPQLRLIVTDAHTDESITACLEVFAHLRDDLVETPSA
ncbi:aminotransferase class I/II-fold pyridoxal phosphate-dependent enzyme [Streptomyces sp. NPDC001948]